MITKALKLPSFEDGVRVILARLNESSTFVGRRPGLKFTHLMLSRGVTRKGQSQNVLIKVLWKKLDLSIVHERLSHPFDTYSGQPRQLAMLPSFCATPWNILTISSSSVKFFIVDTSRNFGASIFESPCSKKIDLIVFRRTGSLEPERSCIVMVF